MAYLWITELDRKPVATGGDSISQIARLPEVTTQQVDFSGGATQSSAFNVDTRFVRLYSDVDCHVLAGANPTATTAKMPLSAGVAETFGVDPGHKISVIAA